MGGVFSKPKAPKIAPPPPVEPEPPPAEVETGAGEAAAKKVRRRRGYASTIITGGLTPAPTGKKSVFG